MQAMRQFWFINWFLLYFCLTQSNLQLETDFLSPNFNELFYSKKPKKPQRRQNNRLKPLTLAYDGDADM